MRLGKPRIYLDRVLKLDGRFVVLPAVVVALATLQVFLLANIGITRARCEQGSQQANRHYGATKPRLINFAHVSQPSH